MNNRSALGVKEMKLIGGQDTATIDMTHPSSYIWGEGISTFFIIRDFY